MLPYIWFFESYTLMIFIGIIACIFVVERFLRSKTTWPLKAIIAIEINGIVAIIIGFIGSNLMQNLYDFIANPQAYTYTTAFTFFGGLIFGVASFLIGYYVWIEKTYHGMMQDVLLVAPGAIALAHGFGRIGCFLNGCCHGIETDAWYGMFFPNLQSRVIPTNLFEAIFLFLLSAILLWMAFHKKSIYAFSIYLLAYGTFRFFIEFLRGDERGEFIPLLTPSQFWSIVAFVSGLGLYLYQYKKRNKQRTL